MRKYFIFFLLLLGTSVTMAQGVLLKGKVTDSSGQSLPGTTLVVKGTTKGAVADLNGNYQLQVSNGNVIVASFIGYQSQEISFTGQPTLNFVLESNAVITDDVVVIGYQTVMKKDLTGAVSVLDKKTVENQTVLGTAGEVLGALPGVMVRTAGQPGAEGLVEIRGTSSFGSSTPLYVIDGIAYDGSANRDMNFNDVESIQVLKDASAAAIYGSRAANGVIIITTKKGASRDMKIDINVRKTFQTLPQYDLMNREQWIAADDEAYKNAGLSTRTHMSGNTDWQDAVFKTGVVDDYNISTSGGDRNANYFISGNYQSNSGTTYGTDSKRYSVRINTQTSRDFGKNVRFTLGENLAISNYKINPLATNPVWQVAQLYPTIPVYDENNPGGYGYGDQNLDSNYGANPIAYEDLQVNEDQNLRIRGAIFTELDLWKIFKYKFNVGVNISNDMHTAMRKYGNWRQNNPEEPTSLNKNQARYNSFVYDNTLEFTKTFGAHSVNAVVGTSFMDTNYEQIWATKNNLLVDGSGEYFDQLDAASDIQNTSGYRTLSKLFSVFGRVNYNYDERYLFSFTMRRDESSRFNPNNSVGYFPSASAAWRISEESFFNVNWIDNLKFRGSYGVLGSSNIGNWDWPGFINSFPTIAIGEDQHSEMAQIQSALTNANLKWEEQTTMNIGLDATLLDNRLNVSAEYFNTTTKDVLTEMEILLSTGNFGGDPVVNAATLENRGFEISIGWRDKINKDWEYSADLNLNQVKNKVKELGYNRTELTNDLTKTVVGQSIGEWYLIKYDGIFKTQAELDDHVDDQGNLIQPEAELGDARWVDANGDGQITDADRQHISSPWPKLELGFNGYLRWRALDMQMQWGGAFGHEVFNDPRSGMDGLTEYNHRTDYDAWHATRNPDGNDPRYYAGDTRNRRWNSSRYIENGSYLRLKQLAFGYTFTDEFNINFVDKLRLYVNFQNILTFTKYSGLDPEFLNTNIWQRGQDNAAQLPNPKGFTIGAQITF
ncbi:MAG: SusC/RagA family TonB-linked outer membrane protein [Bacteroides xylanisolvens]